MSKKSDFTLDPLEKRIIYELSGDIGSGPRPFDDLGRKIGVSEKKALELVAGLAQKGLIRRFGATLRHQRTGFTANAMVAWKIEPQRIETVGRKLSEYPQVTHCYQRKTTSSWPYNVYTMIHGTSEEEVATLATQMAREIEVEDYQLLFSHEELKKTSMRYFS